MTMKNEQQNQEQKTKIQKFISLLLYLIGLIILCHFIETIQLQLFSLTSFERSITFSDETSSHEGSVKNSPINNQLSSTQGQRQVSRQVPVMQYFDLIIIERLLMVGFSFAFIKFKEYKSKRKETNPHHKQLSQDDNGCSDYNNANEIIRNKNAGQNSPKDNQNQIDQCGKQKNDQFSQQYSQIDNENKRQNFIAKLFKTQIVCSFVMALASILLYYTINQHQAMIFISFKGLIPVVTLIIIYVMGLLQLNERIVSNGQFIKQIIIMFWIVTSIAFYKFIQTGECFYVFLEIQFLSSPIILLSFNVIIDALVPILIYYQYHKKSKQNKGKQIIRLIYDLNKWHVIFILLYLILSSEKCPFFHRLFHNYNPFTNNNQISDINYSFIFISLAFLGFIRWLAQIIIVKITVDHRLCYVASFFCLARPVIYVSLFQQLKYVIFKSTLSIIKLTLSIASILGTFLQIYIVLKHQQKSNISLNSAKKQNGNEILNNLSNLEQLQHFGNQLYARKDQQSQEKQLNDNEDQN